MKKRILTMMMAFCVAFTSLPADAAAAGLQTQADVGAAETEAVEIADTEEMEKEAEQPEMPVAEAPEGETEEGLPAETEAGAIEGTEEELPAETEAGAIEGTEEGLPAETEAGAIEGTEEGFPEEAEAGAIEGTEEELPAEAEAGAIEGTEEGLPAETEAGTVEGTEEGLPAETEAGAIEGTEEGLPEEAEAGAVEETEEELPAETEAGNQEEGKVQEGILNFLMVESAMLQTPGTQRVVASVGKGETELSDLALTYRNLTTGKEYTVAAEAVAEDMALFAIEFADAQMAGAYQLLRVDYRSKGAMARVEIPGQEMEVRFGVNTEVSTDPDQVLYDEKALASIEADVITMDENGNILSENTADSGLLPETILNESSLKAASGPVVVVLDPGHDDTHAGAQQNGAGEEDLVLKIAQYCKEELDTYNGISVYMTRNGGGCPNGGSSVTSGVCNEKRVAYAQSVGADLYVSFHLNSALNSSVNGVAVYYPNSNYNAQIGAVGEKVATTIYHKLAALGLSAWGGSGIKIWDSSSYKYPDGSTADYLGVIRNCKSAGIPAVLIEHAFLSGTSDYLNFLNSEEKLKNLGLADAAAIADYYGLSKGMAKPEIQYVKSLNNGKLRINWTAVADSARYEVWRSTKEASGYQRIANVTGTTTYTDSRAETGRKYYYRVCAVSSGGAVSEKSAAVSGMGLAKPQIAHVRSKSSRQIEIAWEKVDGAGGYLILRQNGSDGKYEQVGKTDSAETLSYTDKVSADNRAYSYKVQAYHMANGQQGLGIVSEAKEGRSIAKTKITSIVSKNETSLEIKWKTVAGATGYRIKRSDSKNGTYKVLKNISSKNTASYVDKSVKAGKTYYYKVEAVRKEDGIAGYGGNSAVVSGKTVSKTKIASIVSKSETSLEITWKKVAGATGYRIKRSDSKNGTYKVLKNISSKNTVSYVDKSVKAGKTYYYKAEAVRKADGIAGYSGDSPAVKGSTISKTKIDYVISSDSTTLEIGWKKVDGAWGYLVKRSTSSKGTYKTVKTIQGAGKVTYKDKKLSAGKNYYYKVEVVHQVGKKKGYSGSSPAVRGKTLAATQITALQATSGTSMILKWKKVSGVSGYQIYRSTSKNSGYKRITTLQGANRASYEDVSLQAGKTYYYKIRTFRKNSGKNEYSSYSGIKKAWTLKKVTLSGAGESSGNEITISWKKVSNASGYSIYRSTSAGKGFRKIAAVPSGKRSYTDKEVKAGNVYYYKVAANNSITKGTTGTGDYSEAIGIPVLAKANMGVISLRENGAIRVSWKTVAKASGYELAYSTSKNGTYAVLSKDSSTSFIHKGVKQGRTYYYKVRAYAALEDGSAVYGAWSNVKDQTAAHAIMGKSTADAEQMEAYYNARYAFPKEIYASKGASNAREFFTILQEEAEAEGIKAEVLFAQVILETGGLKFGGDVSPEQCNFGGLGAVGNGAPGETFSDVRTGLRAQAQHLKAYASTSPLNNACVDSRFSYVTRGCAPYIEWLSIPKNPHGKGWAADAAYGDKLLKIIESL